MASAIAALPHGIVRLDVSLNNVLAFLVFRLPTFFTFRLQGSHKAMASLGRALKQNALNASSLVFLDVSGNQFGRFSNARRVCASFVEFLPLLLVPRFRSFSDGSTALATWLALPNPLKTLRNFFLCAGLDFLNRSYFRPGLANVAASVAIVVSAIMRGCTHLEALDLSGNRVREADAGALAQLLQV